MSTDVRLCDSGVENVYKYERECVYSGVESVYTDKNRRNFPVNKLSTDIKLCNRGVENISTDMKVFNPRVEIVYKYKSV